MRTIVLMAKFKRDLKKIQRSVNAQVLIDLDAITVSLASDIPLQERLKDHALSGSWGDSRECHIRPDLLLVYRKEPGILRLVRLGSHSELFKKTGR